MKQLVIEIDPSTGELKAEAFGFKGRNCEETVRKLIGGLGGSSKGKHKAEYHQCNTSSRSTRTLEH